MADFFSIISNFISILFCDAFHKSWKHFYLELKLFGVYTLGLPFVFGWK